MFNGLLLVSILLHPHTIGRTVVVVVVFMPTKKRNKKKLKSNNLRIILYVKIVNLWDEKQQNEQTKHLPTANIFDSSEEKKTRRNCRLAKCREIKNKHRPKSQWVICSMCGASMALYGTCEHLWVFCFDEFDELNEPTNERTTKQKIFV